VSNVTNCSNFNQFGYSNFSTVLQPNFTNCNPNWGIDD